MLLAAAKVVTPERILRPGWLETSGAVIRTVGEGRPPRVPDHDLGDAIVSPGFVDLHCHGGGGSTFMEGPEAAGVVRATHRHHGTTTLMASLVTDSVESLALASAQLAPLVEAGELAGIHLEGPWLSSEHCGAHDATHLRDPRIADIETIRRASRGTVRMVTLAPERHGGLTAIHHLESHGIIPAIGHSDATYVQARAAILAGARVATHVFNGMRPLHHREPGIVGAALTDPGIVVEAISDGVHLHPSIVAQLLESTGGRAILVTDAISAAGSGDGHYRLGPRAIEVRDGIARTPDGALAGSTLTFDAAVRYAVRTAGVCLDTVLRAATLTPATVLGRPDLGRIRPGAVADLVVLTPSLHVMGVIAEGEWIRRA